MTLVKVALWCAFIYVAAMAACIVWTAARVRARVGLVVTLGWACGSFVSVLAGLLAFPLAPIAVAFAERAGTRDIYAGKDGLLMVTVPAYRLPKWASWLETFDDGNGLLPGGTYEAQIRTVYERFGWRVAGVLWLWRNRAYRFRNVFRVDPRASDEFVAYLDDDPPVTLHVSERQLGPITALPWSRMLLVLVNEMGEPEAFEYRHRFAVLGPRDGEYRAGWKLVDYIDGDGLVGAASGSLQPPSPRPFAHADAHA